MGLLGLAVLSWRIVWVTGVFQECLLVAAGSVPIAQLAPGTVGQCQQTLDDVWVLASDVLLFFDFLLEIE